MSIKRGGHTFERVDKPIRTPSHKSGKSQAVIIKKGEMIDEAGCEKIDAAGVKAINVYSVITCGSKEGVCAMSYGRDLS